MTRLHTTSVEKMTMFPSLVDERTPPRQTGFAMFLFDAFTRRPGLVGLYDDPDDERADQAYADRTGDASRVLSRTTVRVDSRSLVPFSKPAGPFVFFVELPAGSHVVHVRSPYYLDRDVTITVPLFGWPAFPDITLANEDLPLEASTQPAAYRDQRASASVMPSVKYPFPASATLVRGTVRVGTTALAGATVRRVGEPPPFAYQTGEFGDYVLFFRDVPGVGASLNIEATHPLHATVASSVQVFRGMTARHDITMI